MLTLLALLFCGWLGFTPLCALLIPRGLAAQPPVAELQADLDRVAAQVAALHAANAGATVHLAQGDLSGRPLYVVVVFPELSVAHPGRQLEPARVRQFIDANLALLRDERNTVGSWYEDATDQSWLDISTVTPDREQALAWARQYNQHTVFDLARLESIAAEGTGEVPPNLPPAEQRLPTATPTAR